MVIIQTCFYELASVPTNKNRKLGQTQCKIFMHTVNKLSLIPTLFGVLQHILWSYKYN